MLSLIRWSMSLITLHTSAPLKDDINIKWKDNDHKMHGVRQEEEWEGINLCIWFASNVLKVANETWLKWHFLLSQAWVESEAVGSKPIKRIYDLPIISILRLSDQYCFLFHIVIDSWGLLYYEALEDTWLQFFVRGSCS